MIQLHSKARYPRSAVDVRQGWQRCAHVETRLEYARRAEGPILTRNNNKTMATIEYLSERAFANSSGVEVQIPLETLHCRKAWAEALSYYHGMIEI